MLAVKSGMRRGELLALRWEDVDLDKGMVQVRGTLRRTREGLTFGVPETAASRRQVVLSPSLVAALRVTKYVSKRNARGSVISG